MRHPFLRPFDTDSRGGPQGPVLRLSNWNVWESQPVGENIGGLTINGTEDYASQGYSGFTIVADPDGKFELNGTLLDLAAPLDFETKAQHFVTIEATHATDPTLTVQRTFTIRLINAAEGEFGPLAIEIPRDTPVGTVVAEITGLDASVSESFWYNNSSQGLFITNGNQLIVAQPIPSDLSEGNYFFWTNGARQYEVFVHFIARRQIQALGYAAIREMSAAGALLFSFEVSNGNGVYTWSIVSDPDDKFTLQDSLVYLKNTVDYATKTWHSLTIRADNGVDPPITGTFTIPVVEPEFTLSNDTVDENYTVGANIGALLVDNLWFDDSEAVYHQANIIDDPDGKFEVLENMLQLRTALDYETAQQHQVTIEAIHESDPSKNIVQIFTIYVTNVIEGVLGPTTVSFVAGSAPGTLICEVTGLDASFGEQLSSVSYPAISIANGNQIVVGDVALSSGQFDVFTVTTDKDRTLEITITAT